jgi:prevent-host-death family protein
MTTVTVHQAKTHLSRLIDRALAGDEVVVTRGREPVVALKPINRPRKRRRLGGLRGIVTLMADDFDAPLADFDEYGDLVNPRR